MLAVLRITEGGNITYSTAWQCNYNTGWQFYVSHRGQF